MRDRALRGIEQKVYPTVARAIADGRVERVLDGVLSLCFGLRLRPYVAEIPAVAYRAERLAAKFARYQVVDGIFTRLSWGKPYSRNIATR
jgi:hypothetical protein